MAGELRIMENKSREDINLSPVSKIEIYSFSIHLAPIASNYQQSYPN
ncbi:putative dithiol-disulfide isomerase domain protein [Staphylococcus aureus 1101-2 2011]|nr:putative dithiol-disulfide isomerase domain protein [Staphylococcus aureus 1101-1 2011]KEK66802.1 putative dithiol-disulfide isomerase domain protein [Staphylococcus aureus 1101-2 2011]